MATRFDQWRDSTRLVVVSAVGLVLLALVAAASASIASDGSTLSSGGTTWAASVVVALLGVALVVAGAVVLITLVGGFERRKDLAEHWWRRELLAMVIVVGLLLALTTVARTRGLPHPAGRQGETATRLVAPPRADRSDGGAASVDWWLVGMLVTTAGVVGGIAVWSIARSRRAAPPATVGEDTAVAAAAAVSLQAVLAEPDPRRGVILAYQQMERSLELAGIPRSAWETPFEYLDRVFLALGAPTAVAATLTELYERAKFGHHAVTLAMRDAAIDALTELATELQVVT